MDKSLFDIRLRQACQARLLTASAVLVGQELLRYVNKVGTCWPALETIAEGVGCSVGTVCAAIRALRAAGLLTWEQRKSAWKRRMSNLYTLLTPKIAQRPAEKKESSFKSSKPIFVIGSPQPPTPTLVAALERLGAALGLPAGDVAPWMTGRT